MEYLFWRENGRIGYTKMTATLRGRELQQGYMDFWTYQKDARKWGFYCADELEFSEVVTDKVPHDIRAMLLLIQE